MTSKNSIRFAIFVMAALLSLSASAERSFSSLEERMTGQEFRETGLYKLTDEELAALNRWVRQRSLAEGELAGGSATGAATIEEDRRGLRDAADRSSIRSRVVGEFTGWSGRSEFQLENGQFWRQTDGSRFSTRTLTDPEVEISPGILGSWYLTVEGYNARVRVERVR